MFSSGDYTAILLADKADAVVYYCSSAASILREVPETVAASLPPELAVDPFDGMLVLGNNLAAQRLASFMVSAPGQAILVRHGPLPVLTQPDATPVLTVVGVSGRPAALSMEGLRSMPAASTGTRRRSIPRALPSRRYRLGRDVRIVTNLFVHWISVRGRVFRSAASTFVRASNFVRLIEFNQAHVSL